MHTVYLTRVPQNRRLLGDETELKANKRVSVLRETDFSGPHPGHRPLEFSLFTSNLRLNKPTEAARL